MAESAQAPERLEVAGKSVVAAVCSLTAEENTASREQWLEAAGIAGAVQEERKL